jgi:hypothetical protein
LVFQLLPGMIAIPKGLLTSYDRTSSYNKTTNIIPSEDFSSARVPVCR